MRNVRSFVAISALCTVHLATPCSADPLWTPLGDDPSDPNTWSVNPVSDFLVFDDGSGESLFVAGYFANWFVQQNETDVVGKWTGSAWSRLGNAQDSPLFSLTPDRSAPSDTSRRARSLVVHDDGAGPQLMIAGGLISRLLFPCDVDVVPYECGFYGVGRWVPSQGSWGPVGTNDPVFTFQLTGPEAMASFQGDLYAGGAFSEIGADQVGGGNGRVAVDNIAVWDGSAWADVGGGIRETSSIPAAVPITDMVEFNGLLVVAGKFDQAGSLGVANIVAWDGTQWQPLGDGLSGGDPQVTLRVVNDLLVFDGSLYAFGNFSQSGTTTLSSGGARWDGSAWFPVGSGLPFEPFAAGLHDEGSGVSIFVGGDVTAQPGSVGTDFIWTLQGADWSQFLPSPFGTLNVRAVASFQGDLVLGGLPYRATSFDPPTPSAVRLARCEGDTNGDRAVDLTDLNAVLGAIGMTGVLPPGVDLNGEGAVDLHDLNIVLANFGSNCS